MKKYLVKLNFPVMINIAKPGEKKYQIIYGFLAPFVDDIEKRKEVEDYIYAYVAYLAAMHQWSNAGLDEFTITASNDWKDKEGIVHNTYSDWSMEIAEHCMYGIGLDYTLSVIDTDDVRDDCYSCGLDESLITCKCCLEHFDRMSGKLHNVCLFNRPIWLPTKILWDGEEGFTHIYGVITEKDTDDDRLYEGKAYQGYLAMCEEQILNGETPSGYTADLEKDGYCWYRDGKEYFILGDEMVKEASVCREKHNLKLYAATELIPQEDLIDGVREGFIISQELYESLLDRITSGKTKVDVQN